MIKNGPQGPFLFFLLKKLITLKTSGILVPDTTIEIDKSAIKDPLIVMLVLLSCYLLIMMREDEAAAASHTASIG